MTETAKPTRTRRTTRRRTPAPSAPTVCPFMSRVRNMKDLFSLSNSKVKFILVFLLGGATATGILSPEVHALLMSILGANPVPPPY